MRRESLRFLDTDVHLHSHNRRQSVRCYQDAPADSPERAEEDRLIGLIHKNTQEEVDDIVRSRMPVDSRYVRIEDLFQVLAQVEEVQDFEGIMYNGGLITKFMDDRIDYEVLTSRGCLVVIGLFIQQARKHSDRLRKETTKTVTVTKQKFVPTMTYLKYFFNRNLNDGRHSYHWRGLPPLNSKISLSIIVVAVTVIMTIGMIASMNGFGATIADRSSETSHTAAAIAAGLDTLLDTSLQQFVSGFSDVGASLGASFDGAIANISTELRTVRATVAASQLAILDAARARAVDALLRPAVEALDAASLLLLDMGYTRSDAVSFLTAESSKWANASLPNTTFSLVIFDRVLGVDLVSNTSAAATDACVVNAPPSTQEPFAAAARRMRFDVQNGSLQTSLGSMMDIDTVVCIRAASESLVSTLSVNCARSILSAAPSSTNVTVSLYERRNATRQAVLLTPAGEGNASAPVTALIANAFDALRHGENVTFETAERSFTIALWEFPAAGIAFVVSVEQTVDIVATATSTVQAINADLGDTLVSLTSGSASGVLSAHRPSATISLHELPAAILADAVGVGAVVAKGALYRDVVSCFFPQLFSPQMTRAVGVMIERDLATLEDSLRAELLSSLTNVRRENYVVEVFTLNGGSPKPLDGASISPSVASFAQQCFFSTSVICIILDGWDSCCAHVTTLGVVVTVRAERKFSLNALLSATGFEMILVAFIVLTSIAIIRILTRVVLDHIEKDYTIYKDQIEKEKVQFSELVKDVMPPYISKRILAGEKLIVDQHPQLTFLFSDIVRFTEKSRKVSTTNMVRILGYMFMVEDGVAEYYGIHKIKTIGDAYFCVSGLGDAKDKQKGQTNDDATTVADSSTVADEWGERPAAHNEPGRPEENQVYRMAAFATTVQLLLGRDYLHFPERTECFAEHMGNKEAPPFRMLSMRMGIHSGPAIAGVVDVGRAPHFDCLGPSVNLASRMESTAMVDRIQLSKPTYDFLRAVDVNNVFEFDEPKKTLVKGYGTIQTYHIRSTTLAVPEILIKTLHIDRATRRQFFTDNGMLHEGDEQSASNPSSRSHSVTESVTSETRDDPRDIHDNVQPLDLPNTNSSSRYEPSSVGAFENPPNVMVDLFGDLPPVPEPP